jgi:ATP-dependent Clp protease ATP-binding subunit ClpA
MVKIVDRLVDETNALLVDNESGVSIILSDSAKTKLSEDGYEPAMGARPLKRVFENEIKKPLSKRILFEGLKDTKIIVTADEDGYNFAEA